MKITKSELKEMIKEAVNEALKDRKVRDDIDKDYRLKKAGLKEDLRDDFDDENEDESFREFGEECLPYSCRAKEVYMDPNNAGKGSVTVGFNNEKVDLLWVCEGNCHYRDFVKLMNCFKDYYKDEVEGKTYKAVMMSRSYPGNGNFIIRKVSFIGGKVDIQDVKIEPSTYEIEVGLDFSEYTNKPMIYIASADGIDGRDSGEANTLKEAEEYFLDELEYEEPYLSIPAGYDVDKYTIHNYEYDDIKPSFTVKDFIKWALNKTGSYEFEDGTEVYDEEEFIQALKDNGPIPLLRGYYSIHYKSKK